MEKAPEGRGSLRKDNEQRHGFHICEVISFEKYHGKALASPAMHRLARRALLPIAGGASRRIDRAISSTVEKLLNLLAELASEQFRIAHRASPPEELKVPHS